MEQKKISEIVKEMKERLSPEKQKQAKSILTPRNAVAVLESHGLICKMEETGKIPTSKGRDLGISSEVRTNIAGERYVQILYNEEAVQLVKQILLEEYPEIDPVLSDGYSTETYPKASGCGRQVARELERNYNVEIILLKDPIRNVFWSYDNSAIFICSLFGTVPAVTPAGNTLFLKSEDAVETVIPALKKSGVKYAVNDDAFTIYKKSKTAQVGCGVVLQDDSGDITKVYLATEEMYTLQIIEPTGETIRVPIIKRNGYSILQEESSLFRAINGKAIGESFECNGIKYKISEIINNPATE